MFSLCLNSTYVPNLQPTSSAFWTDPMKHQVDGDLDIAWQATRKIREEERGLEIGGPTTYLGQMFYTHNGAKMDNVIKPLKDPYDIMGFKGRGGVAPESCESGEDCKSASSSVPFVYNDIVLGNQYFSDGADLPFEDESYSFIVSSHNLEHYPNPMKALLEWNRILKPGGFIFLNLPDPRYTYDRMREASTIYELIKCFHAEASMEDKGYDYMIGRRIEDIIATTFFDLEEGETEEQAKDKWRAMVGDDRDDAWVDKFHWHVFSPSLVEEI